MNPDEFDVSKFIAPLEADGMSLKEIARQTGIPEHQVRSIYRSAAMKMVSRLKEYGVHDLTDICETRYSDNQERYKVNLVQTGSKR